MKRALLSTLTAIAVAFGCVGSAGAADYSSFNPATSVNPVSAQLGGYLVQLNSYDQAFQNMDMYMLSPKKVRKSKLAKKLRKNAQYVNNNEFETTDENSSGSTWTRAFATVEHVDLHNGPNPTNHIYGVYFGGESEMKDLGHDWEGKIGVYGGYNGSHQAVRGNKIFENGGTIGVVGMAFKGDYFVGGTVNVGASAGDAQIDKPSYKNDEFGLLMTGAAVKTGYNWELADGKLIVQPAFQASYSYIDNFDKVAGNGSRMDSNGFSAVQIEPAVKVIGNLNNGWQPYAGISFVYTFFDRTHTWADGVSMPSFSLNPYIKYGFGMRKVWGERFTGFAQMFFMNGGRSGVAMSGGLRYALGKNGTYDISEAKTPELKSAKISLNNKK